MDDQYLTAAELDAAIAEVERDVVQDKRRARVGDWLDQSRTLTELPADQFRNANPGRLPSRDYSTAIDLLYRSEFEELHWARDQVVSAGSELSLVSDEFHRLFSRLPPEQRYALLEADVAGNNDGTVTVREFYLHNRRVFSKRTHFEKDFGEKAYLEVLRLFGVL